MFIAVCIAFLFVSQLQTLTESSCYSRSENGEHQQQHYLATAAAAANLTMKRRNVECNKYRKQFHFRKYKFGEGVYASSTFLYLKFLCAWLLIMVADFMLEFRFEFLWPFWLLIRSLNDSFKYQGIVSARDSLHFSLTSLILISSLFVRVCPSCSRSSSP